MLVDGRSQCHANPGHAVTHPVPSRIWSRNEQPVLKDTNIAMQGTMSVCERVYISHFLSNGHEAKVNHTYVYACIYIYIYKTCIYV